MKILIPGGTGQVGNLLCRAFTATGHEVVVLSRSASSAPWKIVSWDAQSLGPWTAELDGADVVINLAGRSVNCRYTDENRRLIYESRVRSTHIIGQAIANCPSPPPLWLQASTATIYAHRFDAPNDERTGIIGGSEPDAPHHWRFSTDVAKAWEKAATDGPTPATRKVLLRSAVIMSPDRGGIFDVMLGLVRRGLGGAVAGGRQYVSWIHDADFVRAINWLIEHRDLDGPINLASPNPLPNAQFMRLFRQAWGSRIGLPASKCILSLGAIGMRTETELILKSRRVVPTRLLASGFTFQFPDWNEAAQDLCQRWRAANIKGNERSPA